MLFLSRSSLNKKDQKVMHTGFQAAGMFMNSRKLNNLSRSEMMNMFFIDYNLMPLLIQENYLNSMREYKSKRPRVQSLEAMAKAADYISTGDVINRKIRSGMNWKLLPDMALYSTILPC